MGLTRHQLLVIGIGVDVVEVERFAKAMERRGEKFLKRLFTENEISQIKPGPRLCERLAARFAAKEAVVKALGTGVNGFKWREIQILGSHTRPIVCLSGAARGIVSGLGVQQIEVSITHSSREAIATALALGEDEEKARSGRK